MFDFDVKLPAGMTVRISVADRMAPNYCEPEHLREVARLLRIIADTAERGRIPRLQTRAVSTKVREEAAS